MAELANCFRCGNVFVKGIRDICQDCYKKEEEAFQTVNRFLRDRKNRQATLIEIVEGTGVEEALIIKFVREGRLRPSEFPNLCYPCERCETPIQTGRFCKTCILEMKKDLKLHEDLERKAEKEKARVNTYVTINKHKK